MKDGIYQFSEPFATWFRILCEERVVIEERKAAGTYTPPPAHGYQDSKNAAQPPSSKQLSYLKRLGATVMPMSKFEASRMIEDLLRTK